MRADVFKINASGRRPLSDFLIVTQRLGEKDFFPSTFQSRTIIPHQPTEWLGQVTSVNVLACVQTRGWRTRDISGPGDSLAAEATKTRLPIDVTQRYDRWQMHDKKEIVDVIGLSVSASTTYKSPGSKRGVAADGLGHLRLEDLPLLIEASTTLALHLLHTSEYSQSNASAYIVLLIIRGVWIIVLVALFMRSSSAVHQYTACLTESRQTSSPPSPKQGASYCRSYELSRETDLPLRKRPAQAPADFVPASRGGVRDVYLALGTFGGGV